jgi:hypothetical protein
MRRSPDITLAVMLGLIILMTLLAWVNNLIKPSDTPSLVRLGLLFGSLTVWWVALRMNEGRENIWSYVLPLLALGGFIGAGIGLYQFGAHAKGVTDHNAIAEADGNAFLAGGACGALASIPLALIVAGVVSARRKCRSRASACAVPQSSALAESGALPRPSPDDDASNAAARPLLVPEGTIDRRFLLESIDCLACEFAPLKGQLLRASIVSWEEGKPPVIEYARALVMRESEIRLYLRRKKN